MPVREDCIHYQSRTYDDDGETARFCTLGLAPEALWRYPEHGPRYERLTLLGSDVEAGSLAHGPPVEPEPDDEADDIAGVQAEAGAIVAAAHPAAVDALTRPRRRWWPGHRSEPGDGDDFRLSNR
jgi:hypothetical protein